MALTELTIKHLKPKAKAYRLTDGGGLILEVSPSGSKLWRWRFAFQHKEQMLALGKHPIVTLAEARKKRDEARALVEVGKHPAREKKLQKLRKAYEDNNTFERIARDFLEHKQGEIDETYRKQCVARMEQHVFPIIGLLPITEITIPDMVRVVETIGKRGTIEVAKRTKHIVSQTFRYAAQRGLCLHNPAADLRGILPSTVKKHFACVHADKLPELLRAMDARTHDLGYYAMQLLALTFVRTGELIGARWDEIHWEKEEWHIPAERMKMKRPHVVPLCRQALALLREIQPRTGDKPHIFYSAASKRGHISNGILLMQLRRMGYKNQMTGHGFRTLASTMLNEKGYAPDVIERQLAHADTDKVRAAYNRAEYLPERRRMMQDYADILEEMRSHENNHHLLSASLYPLAMVQKSVAQ